MDTVKYCMSIREPYVSLIVAKEKTLEYRSKKLIARTPQTIAIATSKAGAGDYLPGGHIVGVARVSSVVPWNDSNLDFWNRAAMEKSDGLMGGGYAMLISAFAACRPVAVRGNVGIYKAPEGFKPEYAETDAQLKRWWKTARVWSYGAADDDEKELMSLMLKHGLGWRIDD